jgi:hypothetical protein
MIEAFMVTDGGREMPMIQSLHQVELGVRCRILAEAVVACRVKKEQCATEEAEYLDLLAQAEAQVLGGTEGAEGPIELSGLIPPGENPYATAHADKQPHHDR